MALTKVSRGLLNTSIVDNGNATAITIDSSQNVGIGTGSPTGVLTSYKSSNGDPKLGHFYNDNTGSAAEAAVYITNSSSVADGLFLQTYGQNGTTAGGFVQDAAIIGSGSGASGGLSIMTRANADMRFYTNGHTNERLRITSGGLVGVGTNSPSAIDSADKVLAIQGSSAAGINLTAGGAYGGAGMELDSSNSLKFYTAGSEGMRLSSGNLGIGISNPAYKLVVSNGGNGGLEFGPDGIAAGTSFIQAYDRAASQYDALRLYSSHYQFFIGAGTRALDIDTAGNLLVGKTANDNTTAGHRFTASGFTAHVIANDYPLLLNRLSSDGALLTFRKDSTTVGSIGSGTGIYFAGASCGLRMHSGGTKIFPTNGSGSALNNTVSLGAEGARWTQVYATTGTINTSDRNEKQDIATLSDAEQRVAVACKGLLRKFRWIDAVEAKGDDARIHFGIIAQDLQTAFEAEGLDAGRYGMFINTTWTDEETEEEHTSLGVRYSELLAFIISAI